MLKMAIAFAALSMAAHATAQEPQLHPAVLPAVRDWLRAHGSAI